jgi:hypothetical protein
MSLESLPFYRARLDERGRVRPWTLDDLEDFAASSDDPFAGRVAAGAATPVALQIEATSEPIVWTALDGTELGAWAGGLAVLWRRFGLERGETLAFFDYGSNPAVLLSSANFVPQLRRGATDRLGVTAICNDGVASMAGRMASILELVRPAALLVRRDLLAPLADALATTGPEPRGILRWLGVVEVDGAPEMSQLERYRELWGVPIRRLLRADAAFFVAADCDACGLFHVDRSRYALERVGEDVAVTTRFAKLCPAVRYVLGSGEIASGACAREPLAARIAWE